MSAPAFEVPRDVTHVDSVFGFPEDRYLTAAEMGTEFYQGQHIMCDVANALFYFGGCLSDHGLCFKADVDPLKATLALNAMLCSFAPPHEIKIGTVGVALANWCQETPS